MRLFAEADTELEFVFVDDGSVDATFKILAGMADEDARIKVIRLSRNFGSHPALLAAFTHCTGDVASYSGRRSTGSPRSSVSDAPEVARSSLLWCGATDQTRDPSRRNSLPASTINSCAATHCPKSCWRSGHLYGGSSW
ncbi:MAG: glycosyltransferase [Verrucomicrobiaceae bacterium]|nr:glycosyltransferase [Verrucomicrobiaceae bacterium]